MQDKISNEQKAHDLAIAYVTYSAMSSSDMVDLEPFYQDYEQLYPLFLELVERNS